MSTFTGSIEQLEATLVDMGRGMTYPSTPNFAPAVLEGVESARAQRPRRFPPLWPVTPRLVVIIILTLLLAACAAVATYFLYPVPQGFDISITAPGSPRGKDVYLITSDDLEQLTNAPGVDEGATWSPDCSRIVFYSNRDGLGAFYKIYVMNPDGTRVVKLLDSPNTSDAFARWSPDGTRIAFNRTEGYWDPDPAERPGRPWRFSDTSDIYVVNADGTGLTRITSGPGLKVLPDWSPDGRRILFNSGQGENREIFVINVDGTGLRNLTTNAAQDMHAMWSPDSTRIVFASNREQIKEFGPANHAYWPWGGLDIYVMDADGSNVTRLTDHPENDNMPYWSPDGRWISFTSARVSGLGGPHEGGPLAWDIYVMKANGSDLRHVIQGTGHGWSSCKAQR